MKTFLLMISLMVMTAAGTIRSETQHTLASNGLRLFHLLLPVIISP